MCLSARSICVLLHACMILTCMHAFLQLLCENPNQLKANLMVMQSLCKGGKCEQTLCHQPTQNMSSADIFVHWRTLWQSTYGLTTEPQSLRHESEQIIHTHAWHIIFVRNLHVDVSVSTFHLRAFACMYDSYMYACFFTTTLWEPQSTQSKSNGNAKVASCVP